MVVRETAPVDYAIIEVPAMAGDPGHPAADGPATITRALHQAGHEFQTHRVAVQGPTGDVTADAVWVGAQVKEAVGAVVAEGDVPLVLAGSCDVAPAVLAAVDHPVGVIWIDAHADFNTPESSVSGFWPGMTLAVIVGDCGEDVWSVLGWSAVAPERVVLIGVRSVSPEAESVRLRNSGLTIVPWRDGLPERDVETALEALARQVDEVYLHLDLDALDPAVGHGVVDPPVAGGLSRAQLGELLTSILDRFVVVGATIATYVPASDDGSTLEVAIDAVRQIVRGSA